MAFVTIPSGMAIPLYPSIGVASWGAQGQLLDAAGEKIAMVCRAPKTGSVRKIGFHTASVTTGATMEVGLYTVSLTDGFPTGTPINDGASKSITTVVVDAADDFVFKLSGAFDADASVTKGDLIAAVIGNPSASPGNLQIEAWRGHEGVGFPYTALNQGSWITTSLSPTMFLEYSDGTYAPIAGVMPSVGHTNSGQALVFNSADTPDDVGMRFRLPFAARVSSFWLFADLGSDTDVVLQEADDTVLETLTLDANVRRASGEALGFYEFVNTHELAKDTFYRLTVKPGATDISLKKIEMNTVAQMNSLSGGQDIHGTSRKDAGAWSDETTTRYMIGVFIDAIDVATGGGPITHPGMSGGMRG